MVKLIPELMLGKTLQKCSICDCLLNTDLLSSDLVLYSWFKHCNCTYPEVSNELRKWLHRDNSWDQKRRTGGLGKEQQRWVEGGGGCAFVCINLN